MIDAARVAAAAGLRARAPDRRRGRRRRVRQHRRRRARARVAGRRGGRHRADRSADRRRAQGIRVGRDRDARAARRTAAGRAKDATRSCGWAACCAQLERLDRDLQARPPHPLMGTGSLHASIIDGGRELSSYPDRVPAADGAPDDRRRARATRRMQEIAAILDAVARATMPNSRRSHRVDVRAPAVRDRGRSPAAAWRSSGCAGRRDGVSAHPRRA